MVIHLQRRQPAQRRYSRCNSTSVQCDRPLGYRDRQSARPAHNGDQYGRADEVASDDRVRQAIAGRNCDRPIQIDHRTSTTSTLIRRAADGSCHRLRRPQSHARSPSACRMARSATFGAANSMPMVNIRLNPKICDRPESRLSGLLVSYFLNSSIAPERERAVCRVCNVIVVIPYGIGVFHLLP